MDPESTGGEESDDRSASSNDDGEPSVGTADATADATAMLPFDSAASTARADAAIEAAGVGHVVVDDEGGLCVDGIRIQPKRNRELPDGEQDKIHETLCEHVSKLARRVRDMEGALATVGSAIQPFLPNGGMRQFLPSAQPSQTTEAAAPPATGAEAAPCTTLSLLGSADDASPVPSASAASAAAPTASTTFVLAPNHPNSYLNRVRMRVETWANKKLVVAKGGILNCPADSDFPHRIRWENGGLPPTLWAETHPRKFNLAITLRITIGGDNVQCKDEAHILYHANSMLPKERPKLTELKFVCYLVYGSATDGYDPAARPKTSTEKPLFKHPDACLNTYNGKHVSAFFHTEANKQPITAHHATLQNGRIVFKDLCFSEKMLSSNVADGGDGGWRLCIRATHPVLNNMLNFSVLTPVFYTGRRVRAVKPKKEKAQPAADAEEEDVEEDVAEEGGEEGGEEDED
jgi:hypothetical protein